MNATANTPKVRRDGTVTIDGTKIGSVGRGWGGSQKAGLWEATRNLQSRAGSVRVAGTYGTRAEAVGALVKEWTARNPR